MFVYKGLTSANSKWDYLLISDLGPTRYLTGKSPLSLPSSGEVPLNDANMLFSAKLKLQLFPIDESTRRSLEVVSFE